ncbi:MAG TPA: lipase secretion chaperone [Burkholderiaceae bacterium]|nr:lipase secretion chaperone [Burkholderiaceae bacterium]
MHLTSYLRQGGYVAAALASAGLIWYWQAGTPADAPVASGAPPAPAAWNGAIGPGTLAAMPRNAAPEVDTDELPPDGFTIGSNGQLVANRQLRASFDYFLIRGDGADLAARAAQLRAYLKQRLPASAAAQAEALLAPYVAYIRAHDDLLARQQLTLAPGAVPDAQQTERLATWQAQRARLRQQSFPAPLQRAWFGDDDDVLADAVAELRARDAGTDAAASRGGRPGSGGATDAEPDSNTLRQQRLHGATEQAARDAELAEVARDATRSYETAAAEERQWRAHYARYRAAVSQLQGDAASPGDARRRKLEALRTELFPTAGERLRARASGIE